MKDYLKNQFECKKVKAGETLYDTFETNNTLLFVSSGKLIVCNHLSEPLLIINEGYFTLLPAEKHYLIVAIIDTQTVLMQAGTLSDSITNDPEWNPDRLAILPIFPSLAKTIHLIEMNQMETLFRSS